LQSGVAWRGLRITYPSIEALRQAFAPWFTFRRVSAIGALLPPSYVEEWARGRPGLVWALHRLERRLEEAPPLAWLADHYLLELERADPTQKQNICLTNAPACGILNRVAWRSCAR
jgi:hypothetical protein